MAIEQKDFLIEKENFTKTSEWIASRIADIQNKYFVYENKVSSLKKSSGGSYNQDLILAQQIFEFTQKNLQKYKESELQPYFARIDFREKRRDVESFYIGKFGLNDELNNEEVVIDWRAPIANLYYSGTFGQCYYNSPMGIIEGELSLKRKFLIQNGKLIDIFDEGINDIILKTSAEGNDLIDEFLRVNLEQNMTKKLKDVVATIQKEQNEIIRAFKNKPIIIQGSAGSGKTTVALHRLAYLIYTYGNETENQNILVVAPNMIFLDYISDVLPNLGVYNVNQKTFEQLCQEVLKIKGNLITKDKKLTKIMENDSEEENKYIKASSKLKGSLVFKSILDRYIKYMESIDIDVTDILVEGYPLFTAKEIKKLYARDLEHLPSTKRKEEIYKYFKQKLKDKIVEVENLIDKDYYYKIMDIKAINTLNDELKRKQIREIYDERDEKKKSIKISSNKVLNNFFKNWNSINLIDYYFNLFENEDLFNKITDGKIPTALYNYLKKELKENNVKNIIDSDDLTALTYLKIKIEGLNTENYLHIVVDEAQDYSYFQLYLLDEISRNHSMTVVGDLGQGIYNYKGINSWEKLIESVFKNDATYITLSQSYRSTIEIIDYANKVLDKQNIGIVPATPVLRHGERPTISRTSSEDEEVKTIDCIVKDVLHKNKKTIALICKTFSDCKDLYNILKKKSSFIWVLIDENENNINNDFLIIPSYMTKGLEFDATIIYNCDSVNYCNNDLDKKLLYVSLTRALHLQYIIYRNTITELLE